MIGGDTFTVGTECLIACVGHAPSVPGPHAAEKTPAAACGHRPRAAKPVDDRSQTAVGSSTAATW